MSNPLESESGNSAASIATTYLGYLFNLDEPRGFHSSTWLDARFLGRRTHSQDEHRFVSLLHRQPSRTELHYGEIPYILIIRYALASSQTIYLYGKKPHSPGLTKEGAI